MVIKFTIWYIAAIQKILIMAAVIPASRTAEWWSWLLLHVAQIRTFQLWEFIAIIFFCNYAKIISTFWSFLQSWGDDFFGSQYVTKGLRTWSSWPWPCLNHLDNLLGLTVDCLHSRMSLGAFCFECNLQWSSADVWQPLIQEAGRKLAEDRKEEPM